MKILLFIIGKTSAAYLREGIEEYTKRLKHYVPFEIIQLPDVKTGKGITEAMQKQAEGEAMLRRINAPDFVVLLDERGREFSSRELAQWLDKRISLAGAGNLVFIIGGPYGFAQSVYDRANALISFSRLTFSHEMIRLLFVEQIYRAMTILRGEPYHHD